MAGRASEVAAAMPVGGCNEVRLTGRVSQEPVERKLPSGDRVVTLRVVVPRRPPRGGRAVARTTAGGRSSGSSTGSTAGTDAGRPGPTVDVIDVGCWSVAARRSALRLREGDQVKVTGALRRRFFRGVAGLQSRYEVEASAVRRAP